MTSRSHSHTTDLNLATAIGSVSRGGQASSIAAGSRSYATIGNFVGAASSREYQTSSPLMSKWDSNGFDPYIGSLRQSKSKEGVEPKAGNDHRLGLPVDILAAEYGHHDLCFTNISGGDREQILVQNDKVSPLSDLD